MIGTRWIAGGLWVLLLGVAGCDNGEITFVDGELSQGEIAELLEVLAAVGSFDAGATSPPPMAASAGAQGVPFSTTVEWSAPCPGGGTIGAMGSLAGETEGTGGGLEASYDATLAYDGCTGTSEAGKTFVINGSVTTGVDVLAVDGTFTLDGTQSGELAWETDGRSGSCTLDLTFSGSASGGSSSSSITGSVCGVTVSQTVTVG